MKFSVTKASDWEFRDYKIFHSIDQIYDYLKKYKTWDDLKRERGRLSIR